MTTLPLLITKTAKALLLILRETTYDDMAHQASDWSPEEIRRESKTCSSQPIKLDFAVPKQNRLAWVRRTIRQLPH